MYFGLSRSLMAVLATVVIVGGASYAFLAAVSGLPTGTHAGAATVTVSGYTISGLSYTYDAANPDDITNVEFTLDNAAAVVHLQLTGGGSWYRVYRERRARRHLQAAPTRCGTARRRSSGDGDGAGSDQRHRPQLAQKGRLT